MATKIILFSIPAFFILIFIELYFDRKNKTGHYRINDSLMSLSLGIISRTKLLVIFSFAAIVYAWTADKLAITQMPNDSIFTWIFSFVTPSHHVFVMGKTKFISIKIMGRFY